MARQQDGESIVVTSQISASLQELSATAQQIANCLAFLTIRFSEYRKKPNSERIPFLNSLGFDRHTIAAILDTTPNTVSVRLSQLKASKKRQKSDTEEA